MKWFIISAFWFLYWGICFLCTGTDKKNLAGLRSYPDAVQLVVCERLADAPKEKSIPSILLGNLILFTVVFSALGLGFKNVLNFDDYLSAFWYFLILGEGLDCMTFWSSICSGGATRNASAFPSCRIRKFTKTRQSTSAHLCAAFHCSPLSLQ